MITLDTPIARIISVFSRCPDCGSRLRYRAERDRWHCANCGVVLILPRPDAVTFAAGKNN
jgi:ribosomal protein L37AE/L43A